MLNSETGKPVVPRKQRLDILLVERGLVPTRAKARILIMAGEVLVNGERKDRPGISVRSDAELKLKQPMPYVSRGGFKLAGALDLFGLDVDSRVCADVGACTGGFTDVLLQRGAARVYAIDVGYGQLDWRLRQDDRVVVLERTNARHLESLDERIDLVTVDVSFISLKLIIPAAQKWIGPDSDIIALIKPQFEAGRKQVGKGGVVRDPEVRRQVLLGFVDWALQQGLVVKNLVRSSLTGASGNVEYVIWLRKDGEGAASATALVERELDRH
jgi:23S rRNA (cytidine1920-2'-O)/16S rRNA (cytidine1409-2'-O)-methyltransferase